MEMNFMLIWSHRRPSWCSCRSPAIASRSSCRGYNWPFSGGVWADVLSSGRFGTDWKSMNCSLAKLTSFTGFLALFFDWFAHNPYHVFVWWWKYFLWGSPCFLPESQRLTALSRQACLSHNSTWLSLFVKSDMNNSERPVHALAEKGEFPTQWQLEIKRC